MTETVTATTTPTSEVSLREALLNQMLAGPTSPEVASLLLRKALKKMYSTLDLDPHNTVVGEPNWDVVDGNIVELPTRYTSLSDLLAERVGESESTLLIEGLHFLTKLPLTFPPVHLPVRISLIGLLINELAPAMASAFQEQQLVYWNTPLGTAGPRWHELSSNLRKIWNVSQVPGWTATECDMARQLFLYPDLQDRKRHDRYDSHAYLIDIDEVDGDTVNRVNENSIVALSATIDRKEVILTYSLRNGYEKFASQDALGQSLPTHLNSAKRTRIQWRLYEPDGNVFDHKACGLIAMQVKVIGDPGFLEGLIADDREQADNEGAGRDNEPAEDWFQKQIPGWLQAAPTSDQFLFAQHLKNLSALGSAHAGKTYMEGIPSIKQYTLNSLKQKMLSDHADASTLHLESIEVQIRSPVVWGTFVVPGKIQTTRFSLVELALQNLIALPLGDKIVRSVDGHALPKWMTADYVENLVTQIDIGRVYPNLIKNKLLDDPAESSRRENLYAAQLRIQLPLLALESKIRGLGDIDERGYRYVAALMEPKASERQVDGQTIVLRPLAFESKHALSTSADVVTNMFVIGPKDPDAGPCLLYQPLLEPQLCQYPSLSNLIYAIRQTASLRQSVLAWLPDGVRATYSRFVFPGPLPSPWAMVEFAVDPVSSWLNSTPIGLSEKTLGADFLPQLFKANADALVELADRQSVSNSENRWATFKQAGWLIFNLALPYLGTAVGTAAWLWQILDDLETLTQSDETSNRQATGEAFVDLLLNMSMAITTHAIDRARESANSRRPEAPAVVHELESPTKPELVIERLAPLAHKKPSPEHYDAIRASGALTGQPAKRAKLLESFSVNEPENAEHPMIEGALKGLYQQGGNWYAKIANQWFNVTAEGEHVSIVDENDPARTGPPLINDAAGEWRVDPRLRLRGSGSKGVRQKIIADAKRLSTQLLAELNRFEERKTQNQKLLTMNAKEMNQASGSSREARHNVYLSTLRTQRESYEEALEILIQWPVFQSRPDAPQARLGYLNAQINFTFEEIDTLQERFAPALRTAVDMTTSNIESVEQEHVDAADRMIRIGDDMIERLDYMETRFSRLRKVGREGIELLRQHRGKMPAYKSDAIRLIQLDMYRHLCLSLESVNDIPEGWADMNQLVDNTTVAFQSLHDAIDERSVIRLDEQIDAFGSLTEQFTAIEEHIQYLGDEYKDSVRTTELNRLGKQVGNLKKRALHHLARALDERSNQRSEAGPYRERPRPKKKFIRARFWGLVSGEPRLTKTLEETDWVDVKHPLTDRVIATFHRKETGEWLPHVNTNTPLAVPVLATSLTKGKALLDGLAAFKAQIEQYTKKPERSPTGIGLLLNAHANRMEKVAIAITKGLDNASNETVGISAEQQRLAQSTRTALKKASKTLHDESFETVLNVIKQRPPTMSDVLWLKSRNQISITKQKNRQRIKAPLHGYLDRYEIKDLSTNKTLWFADFHYSRNWVPPHAFLSARLRTPEQVSQGAAVESTQTLNQRQLIEHYRSEIAVDQAKEVFFPKQVS
ncbi:dermonecrotic toxin domain-containing protein [Pseudomonas sp. KB_12]|uniref:dermonecrotic toxin domain-containing protein n=1 Tax=Pseudomonas sp. KB_12 TaxID=3233034 RepID=UPI003F9A7D2B